MDRRTLITSALAAGAVMAAPTGALAQFGGTAARDRKLLSIAREEIARAIEGGNHVWRTDIVGIADFGLHSSQRRFHFVDLEKERVESYHVSHGTGSDPEHDGFLKRYSNTEGSNATSRGAYVTWEWYVGRYGTSVRLGGIDPTNEAAFRRAIVMHRANYAEPEHIDRWGRLGRSNGCFAMGEEQFRIALMNLSGGRLLFADSLGLANEGERLAVNEIELLQPVRPLASQRYNPAIY